MKFNFIKLYRSEFFVEKMCNLLEVSTSGFYEWLDRSDSKREIENQGIVEKIRQIHEGPKRVYGSPRITQELQDECFAVSENRIARLMKKAGISAKTSKKFKVVTTDSKHNYPVSPNLLNRDFAAKKPNQVWLSDITYIRLGNKFGYLCAIMDLFNREVIGWSFAMHMHTDLVVDAFKKAVRKTNPEPSLIFHSDRGSQYASKDFREHLEIMGFKSSMSRKGDCWDNAPMESFFHTLKTEEVYCKDYKQFKVARNNIFDYIEVFYNRIRKHSSLGYLSPLQYLEKCA